MQAKLTKSGRRMRKYIPKWRNWEQKELVLMQFAQWYWQPVREPLKFYADKIGVNPQTLRTWTKDDLFKKISSEIREEIRKTIGPLIDRKLFKRAMEGSFPHMNLYYQLCGDLTTKIEHSNKPTDIPKDPKEIQEEINKLTQEVGSLPKAIEMQNRLNEERKRKSNKKTVAALGKLIRV